MLSLRRSRSLCRRQRKLLQSQQLAPDKAHQQNAIEDADQPDVEPHVAVENVAELVGDDALQLVARKLLSAAARDADDRIARRKAGRKCIDGRLVAQQIHGRHRHARGERHLFHHVQQPPFDGIDRVRIHAPSAQPLGDDRAAAGGKLGRFVEAADDDQTECRGTGQERHCDRKPPMLAAASGARRQCRHDKRRAHDCEHREHEHRDEPLRVPASNGLAFEEICSHSDLD